MLAIADASLLAMRARSNPGTAIAAMMPMIATTRRSSMSVNPISCGLRMVLSALCKNIAAFKSHKTAQIQALSDSELTVRVTSL
jgi:hypothetical protein